MVISFICSYYHLYKTFYILFCFVFRIARSF